MSAASTDGVLGNDDGDDNDIFVVFCQTLYTVIVDTLAQKGANKEHCSLLIVYVCLML